VSVCTTTYSDGIIAVIDPELSFLFFPFDSKGKHVRGIYPVRVKARIPAEVGELESRIIRYRPRIQAYHHYR
ncbi:hypothetical protein M404DRAFT_138177, partial [Pisolithus tinctorius Marx 270]